MTDGIQVAIVSVVAAAALVALVRPYLRRSELKKGAPPCANCAASTAPPSASRRPTHG
jgi:hypothetical protein